MKKSFRKLTALTLSILNASTLTACNNGKSEKKAVVRSIVPTVHNRRISKKLKLQSHSSMLSGLKLTMLYVPLTL